MSPGITESQEASRQPADPVGPRQIGLAQLVLWASLLIVVAVPATAARAAGSESAPPPDASSTGGAVAGTPQLAGQPTGGSQHGATTPAPQKPKKKRKRKRAVAPVIKKFSLGATALFDEGRPLPVRFRVTARHSAVHVWVVVRTRAGKRVGSVDLGMQPTGKVVEIDVSEDRLGIRAEGNYQFRLSVRDKRGRRAARASGVHAWLGLDFSVHRFPIAGDFSWGGADGHFGAPRSGHKHQGQDLAAAEGTPVVAPHAGTISWISYQANGAGHYIVLDSAGEDRDYVFMHLKAGSIGVKRGQRVPTGKLLAKVGNTGRSFGAHLHFETWTGGNWFAGGHAIDPLPLLRAWYKSAPGGADAQSLTAEPPNDG